MVAELEKKIASINEAAKILNDYKAAFDAKNKDIEIKYDRILAIHNKLFVDAEDAKCINDAIEEFEKEIRNTHAISIKLGSEISETHDHILGYDKPIKRYENIEEQKKNGAPIQKDDKGKEYWVENKHIDGLNDKITRQYQEILAIQKNAEQSFTDHEYNTKNVARLFFLKLINCSREQHHLV